MAMTRIDFRKIGDGESVRLDSGHELVAGYANGTGRGYTIYTPIRFRFAAPSAGSRSGGDSHVDTDPWTAAEARASLARELDPCDEATCDAGCYDED
jgi:hypothetical protein